MDFIYRRAQCFQITGLSCAQLYCELVSGCNKYVVSSCIPEKKYLRVAFCYVLICSINMRTTCKESLIKLNREAVLRKLIPSFSNTGIVS
jgi:hypothetical protein